MFNDLGDEQIQQCIYDKNITNILLEGSSVRLIVEMYLTQKLQNIQMVNATNADEGRTVTLSTLSMPHLLWHNSLEVQREKFESDFPEVSESKDEHYFMTGFYYSSEREPHVQVDRSLQFSKMAYDILTKKVSIQFHFTYWNISFASCTHNI